MAISFREQPWYVQMVAYLLLSAVLVLVAWYVPGSPLSTERDKLVQLQKERATLSKEVTELDNIRRRHAEFRSKIEALEQQLKALQAIVPEEKDVDEFIRMVHQTAVEANVAVRRLTAKPTVPREHHADLPFELEVDGPYYAIQDFFAQLGRLSRITNVGDLSFEAIPDARAKKLQVRPGTTVTGTLTLTTFYSKGAEPPPDKPAKKGKTQPKRPAKK